MTSYKKVIVAGATGFLGKHIVEALLQSGFQVSILSRDLKKSLPNTKTIVTDYTLASLRDCLRGHQVVVSTIGAAGLGSQYALIDAAVSVGVQRFIPSHYAPSTLDLSSLKEDIPQLYARLKPRQDVIMYLQQQQLSNPTFTWTAIGCFPLFEWALMTGAQGVSIRNDVASVTDSGNEPFIMTTTSQIGRAISKALIESDLTANRYLLIKSFQTTQNQLIEMIQDVKGSKVEVTRVPADKRREDGVQLISQGNFAGLGYLWNVWLNSDGKGYVPDESHFANELLNLPKEDLRSSIEGLVEATA